MKKNKNDTRAIALRYTGEGAPTVSAKGSGLVAEQILSMAQEHNIPLHEDADLVALLSRLELGDEIPVALYTAVAEVLALAYRMSREHLSEIDSPLDPVHPCPSQ